MPELNRRTALAVGLGVVGAAVLTTTTAQARPVASHALPVASAPAPLKRSAFTPALGQTFTAKSASATYTLTLAEISDLPHLAAGYADTCFSLVFHALEGANPPDGVYALANATSGDHSLFISKVDLHTDTRKLQAVINQSVLVL